jgi:hypothetical protein
MRAPRTLGAAKVLVGEQLLAYGQRSGGFTDEAFTEKVADEAIRTWVRDNWDALPSLCDLLRAMTQCEHSHGLSAVSDRYEDMLREHNIAKKLLSGAPQTGIRELIETCLKDEEWFTALIPLLNQLCRGV